MPTNANLFKHISAGRALTLAKVLDGVNSADTLCKSGWSYPNAIAISKMITAGVADIGALHRMGHSASDAVAIAAAVTAAGAH
jgi:hypothetical protein